MPKTTDTDDQKLDKFGDPYPDEITPEWIADQTAKEQALEQATLQRRREVAAWNKVQANAKK